jgi:hypothetical protein
MSTKRNMLNNRQVVALVKHVEAHYDEYKNLQQEDARLRIQEKVGFPLSLGNIGALRDHGMPIGLRAGPKKGHQCEVDLRLIAGCMVDLMSRAKLPMDPRLLELAKPA